MRFFMQETFVITNDDNLETVEVGKDADNMGCVEIRVTSEEGKVIDRITLVPDQVPMVIEALQAVCNRIKSEHRE